MSTNELPQTACKATASQTKPLPVLKLSDFSEEFIQQMEDEATIQKIKKYIKNTKEKECTCYDLYLNEAVAIYRQRDPIHGIMLAFAYGRSKGYRAAQNAHKRREI